MFKSRLKPLHNIPPLTPTLQAVFAGGWPYFADPDAIKMRSAN